MTTHYCYTDSPFGKLLLVGDFQGLSLINFQDGIAPVLPIAPGTGAKVKALVITLSP